MKRSRTTHIPHIPRIHQHGQAMVEFLVATSLVLSVLFLAIVMLGKFNDVRNKTLLGARYVAWERTVWRNDTTASVQAETEDDGWYALHGSSALALAKSDDALKQEFLQRMVAANGTPIAGADGQVDRLPAAQQAMWFDHGGHTLLGATDDVVVTTGTDESPATALAQYTAGSFASMQTAGNGTFDASMDLSTRNLQSGTLSVSVAKDSDAIKLLWPNFTGLTFADTNVLLTNTWLPEGSANGEQLFSQATPAANASLVQPSLYTSLKPYAPEIDTLEIGRVQGDVVPADRLSP
jgi:hypothetical protein